MNSNPSDGGGLPECLVALTRSLLSAGFALKQIVQEPLSFGDQLLEWEREYSRIRFVKDRGQWWIDIGGSRGSWFSPQVWIASAEGKAALEVVSIEEQAKMVERVLSSYISMNEQELPE